jgi:hypothetical protein
VVVKLLAVAALFVAWCVWVVRDEMARDETKWIENEERE